MTSGWADTLGAGRGGPAAAGCCAVGCWATGRTPLGSGRRRRRCHGPGTVPRRLAALGLGDEGVGCGLCGCRSGGRLGPRQERCGPLAGLLLVASAALGLDPCACLVFGLTPRLFLGLLARLGLGLGLGLGFGPRRGFGSGGGLGRLLGSAGSLEGGRSLTRLFGLAGGFGLGRLVLGLGGGRALGLDLGQSGRLSGPLRFGLGSGQCGGFVLAPSLGIGLVPTALLGLGPRLGLGLGPRLGLFFGPRLGFLLGGGEPLGLLFGQRAARRAASAASASSRAVSAAAAVAAASSSGVGPAGPAGSIGASAALARPCSSMPTAALTRSTMPCLAGSTDSSTTGSGAAAGASMRSPTHSRNLPQEPQNSSLSSLWLPQLVQTIMP